MSLQALWLLDGRPIIKRRSSMEILREDFLKYVDEIRRCLLSIQPHLQTDKAIDEVDCIDRILCLFEAEHDYRADNYPSINAQLEEIIALLEPSLDQGKLPAMASVIAQLDSADWKNPDQRLLALRKLFQHHIPDIAEVAELGNGNAREALMRMLSFETRQLDCIHQRRQAFYVLDSDKCNESGSNIEDGTLSRSALEGYLRSVFSKESSLRVDDIQNIPGGRSKETTLITLQGTHSLPGRIVMRSDVEGGLVPSYTVDEYAVIKAVDRWGEVPVPSPLHCETDKSLLGRTFMLMEAVTGSTKGE